ncbi:hypothetical protein JCM15093_155 [Bacteroides graminisolvens DSM 19988 = JCM 15093]|uniref:DUF3316 domain-containing protein n=1 Tax=Bacteroides graminisolvens DSM 19988 = JCM 15093 TaxID=1121097 RepID=A0A069D4K5_9BACE|nr:hypothetical protein JCM15093_155 [Bacteroides graminisolvens DSM 19988 = JCM 15093]
MVWGICVFAQTALQAQEDSLKASRYLMRATLYGVGYSNVYDTYLSPQEYKGMDFRVTRETMRMTTLFDGNVSAQNFFQANLSYTHNRADNNNTFAGLVNWNYGLHYQFRITENFKLLAGGLADFNGGFVYNLRNTNNPASAKAYINLDASGMAIWHVKVKNVPLTLRYQLNVPVAGVLFSPNYGQSYYEIFTLGNSDGVVRFTSLHNQPSFRQMLSVDFPVGSSKVRMSYVCDIQQSDVNEIQTHIYSHVFMVGFVKDLYRIKNKKELLCRLPCGHIKERQK